jgi:hypothetical protein
MQAVQRALRKGSLNCVTPGVSVDQRHSITKSYGIWGLPQGTYGRFLTWRRLRSAAFHVISSNASNSLPHPRLKLWMADSRSWTRTVRASPMFTVKPIRWRDA